MSRKPLRLMPGVVLAALLVVLRYVLPFVIPDGELRDSLQGIGLIGGLAGALLIGLWWLFLSRAPWAERLGAIAVMAAALFATRFFLHPSILGGMMGFMLYVYAIPVMTIALVVWAVAFHASSPGRRRVAMIVIISTAGAGWALVRSEGVIAGGSDLHWRWSMTPEERLLAQGGDALEPSPPAAAAIEIPEAAVASTPSPVAAPAPARVEWPGFRGPRRDSVIRGVQIETDWLKSPPQQLWRRAIGPGWSSFAIRGDILYTQEQRGDVSSLRLTV